MASAFSTAELVEALGLSERQVDGLARKGIVRPSVTEARGTGSARRWNELDALAIVAVRFFVESGHPLGSLKGVQAAVREAGSLDEAEGYELMLTYKHSLPRGVLRSLGVERTPTTDSLLPTVTLRRLGLPWVREGPFNCVPLRELAQGVRRVLEGVRARAASGRQGAAA